MFEWQEQYLTSEHSVLVRYCYCHKNIKFISLSQDFTVIILFRQQEIVRDGPLENLWGVGEVQKKYFRKGKLNEKKFMHAK